MSFGTPEGRQLRINIIRKIAERYEGKLSFADFRTIMSYSEIMSNGNIELEYCLQVADDYVNDKDGLRTMLTIMNEFNRLTKKS